jgi:hypothetical protein
MRGFLLIFLIIMIIVTFMPVILSAAVFIALLCLLAFFLRNAGLWPGMFFRKRYGPGAGGRKKESPPRRRAEEGRANGEGWYGAGQEGPEIILPESALRKESDQDTEKNR